MTIAELYEDMKQVMRDGLPSDIPDEASLMRYCIARRVAMAELERAKLTNSVH